MDKEQPKRRVAILGSTGSIGTQALEVVRKNKSALEVEVLTAYSNGALLLKQALEFKPNTVVIGDEAQVATLKETLWPRGIKVYGGAQAISDVVQMDTVDIVLTAMVGYSGLLPTIKAIEAGKPIALANKETLVVAGELITQLAAMHGVNIYPVDSEHSAIFQCLAGEFHNPIEKIILTASGGPFRGKSTEELIGVTRQQALKHPNWEMGAKITIDSATLMNKGLEVIEAKWLFAIQAAQIEVIVHPQSIIHSLVQFKDGSIKAQLGLPDMKLPIQYALGYPKRWPSDFPRFNFADYPSLTFEAPDMEAFPNLKLAFDALQKGGNAPCILNASNEVAVQAFLEERISFTGISGLNAFCLQRASFIEKPTLEDYIQSNAEVRTLAEDHLQLFARN
jgi:1-deoxy-D-xylulose-5-phosphate reductoisomerase